MGTDIADFNNDGLVDIVVLDMMPEDNFRQKMMFGKPNDDRFKLTFTSSTFPSTYATPYNSITAPPPSVPL